MLKNILTTFLNYWRGYAWKIILRKFKTPQIQSRCKENLTSTSTHLSTHLSIHCLPLIYSLVTMAAGTAGDFICTSPQRFPAPLEGCPCKIRYITHPASYGSPLGSLQSWLYQENLRRELTWRHSNQVREPS